MMVLVVLCLLAVVLVIGIDIIAWQLIRRRRETAALSQRNEWPIVAVFVPARNEEQHLPGCLGSLLELDYPQNQLHILIGNDASTDNTLAIAQQWSLEHPQIKVLDITCTIGMARGKANVLAQLAHACPAEINYFFMTDADIRPHRQWIQSMLQGMQPGVGLVNGTTAVCGAGVAARWQQTDWALALGLAKAYTYLPRIERTLTAIGNNMLVSREAYESTGGYESIPFSITEDYELMQQLRKKGYIAVHLMNSGSSACTEAVDGLGKLLHQRKRWMTGAMRLPLPMIILLFMQALFFPAIVVILLLLPLLGILLLLLKILVQYLLAKAVLARIGIEQSPRAGLLYELYSFLLNLLLTVFYFLPIEINWKDRTYRNNRA